jgi:hypothetical protein
VCAVSGEDEGLTAADGTDRTGGVRGARGRRLAVVAVTAAVLAVGGGTYLAVSPGHGKNGPEASATLPATAPPGFRPTAHPVRPLPGTPRATAFPADPAPAPPGTYRLAGPLPQDGPATAASYRPSGSPDPHSVQQLAAALGLKGPVRHDAGAYRVGSASGTGPALLVSTDPQATWSYASNDASSDTVGAPVSEQRARDTAAPLLAQLGLTSARIDASHTGGTSRTVTADPVVGGLPTHGWDTGISVGPDGRVSSAHGHLATLVKGETERVVSAAQAFKELPGPRLMHPGARACAAGDAANTAAPSTLPCAAPRPVRVDITGAEFGLTLTFASGGARLTPAWLFTAASHPSGPPYVLPQPAAA